MGRIKIKYLIKLIVVIVSTSIVSSCSSTKSLAKEGITLIEGSDLYYEVQAGDEKWNFDLNINHFENSISFVFDLDTKSGTISIDEKALEESTDLHNYFNNGYKRLTEKTAVWVSKKMFKDVKAGKPVTIGLSNDDSEKWNNSFGGGVFVNMANMLTGNISAFNSDDGLRLAFKSLNNFLLTQTEVFSVSLL
jgi:hypothetical protein